MDTEIGWFLKIYERIHGPLVIPLCVFGILANVANIVVLTRRHMITPTNVLLTGLSSAQLLLLINYLIYTIYGIYDTECIVWTKSYAWLSYILLNVNLNLVFHTVGLVHTTMLAVFRYAAVAYPTRSKNLVSIRGAKSVLITAFMSVPIVCSTFYPNSKVVANTSTNDSDECPDWILRNLTVTVYNLRYADDRPWLRDYNFWFFGTVCKLLPCHLLVILSALLIRELRLVQKRRQRLTNQNNVNNKRKSSTVSERNHGQITIMLICIVLLFVLVELPQGIMNMLSAILKDEFIQIYTHLGDFFEMLTVLYSSVNFILYCTMSTQFRATFKVIFMAPLCGLIGVRNYGGDRRLSKATTGTEPTRTHDYITTALIDTAV